jgi:6-phosphogluconolactonase
MRYAAEKWALGKPIFDLVLLGMVEEGHTAGLFSESDLHRADDRIVVLTEAPRNPRYRMTLAPRVLRSAKKIIVLIQGLEKTRVLMANLFGEREDPIRVFLGDTCEVISLI